MAAVWSGPLVNDGGWLTGVTWMTNVCAAEVSLPPLVVPPLSWSVTVTVASPLASGSAGKDSVPVGATLVCAANRALLLLVVLKLTDWSDSLAGPGWMFVAQFGTFCTAGAAL